MSQRNHFQDVMQSLRKKGIKFMLRYPTRLQIQHQAAGTHTVFEDPMEAARFVESPLTMSLNLSLPNQSYPWHFNPSLLADSKFVDYITTNLKEFLEFNDNREVSDFILWETLKVVMRGHIISYESKAKKEREK
ncbi:hypothetical protein QQF64_009520 [Cirrhinus molitorella]|uniref:Uncharacterized protein n=1 Tax=Cirrhinus molitorella TaxID=172907 RepID=A0ABR3M1G1_9TELE